MSPGVLFVWKVSWLYEKVYDFVNFGGCAAILNTVFTWLNAAELINTLVPKINAMTIQICSLLIAHKQCLCP